jgi:hypothetical protein
MTGDEKYSFLRDGGTGPWYGALRFLLANTGVTAALIGASSPAQVDNDLEALGDAGALTEAWRQGMADAVDGVQLTDPGFCTGCRYCEVCTHGFSPSKLMQALRNAKLYNVGQGDLKQWIYSAYVHDLLPEEQLARCAECGACELKCPQHLKIVDEIKRVKKIFSVSPVNQTR